MRYYLTIAALWLSGCSTMGLRVSGYVLPKGGGVPSVVGETVQDGVVAATLLGMDGQSLFLLLQNRSDSDALVLWDSSSLAIAGQSYRVVNGATRTLHTQLVQPPLAIQPHTEAQVVVVAPDLPLPVPRAGGEFGRLRLRVAALGAEAPLDVRLVVRQLPLQKPVLYDEVHRVPVGTVHVALCAITSVFYGGWCWAYLAMPFESHRMEVVKRSGADIESRYGGRLAGSQSLNVERVSW